MASPIPDSSASACKRFLIIGIGTAMLMLAAIMAFNWLMNPLQAFRPPLIRGVNDTANKDVYKHERLFKACQIERVRPATVMVGSSRVNVGLSPHHPGWGTQPVYNLGISGGSLDYTRAYFEHACAVSNLKEALVMVDYASPGPTGNRVPLPEQHWLDDCQGKASSKRTSHRLQQCLLSLDAMRAGWGHLAGSHTRFPVFDGHGMLQQSSVWSTRWQPKQGGEFVDWPEGFDLARPPFVGPGNYGRDWRYLEEILALSQSREIKVTLVVSPVHDLLWKRYIASDGLESVLAWRSELLATVQMVAAASGRPPVRVWDFSLNPWAAMSPAEIAEERAQRIPLYLESSHFSTRVGDRLLDRMLLDPVGPDPACGVLLTPANLETQIEALARRWRS